MSTSELQQHIENPDAHPQYMLESVIEALGDLLVGQGASAPEALPIGNAYDVLIVSPDTPHQPQWVYVGLVAIPRTVMQHKGDILVGTGQGSYVILPVGSAGQVLIPNPDTPSGLEWVDLIDVCPFRLDFSYVCDSQYLGVI